MERIWLYPCYQAEPAPPLNARHWLNTEQKTRSIELGRKLLEKEARRFRVNVKKLIADGAFDTILEESGFARIEDLLAEHFDLDESGVVLDLTGGNPAAA